ncbi:hypothetical protein HCX48_05755 [Rhodocyclus tenuis]|uniref:Transglutaminase n=1 Tax=Rhodocyclus gracilis TaxID=2929842 RepID=A0ABX0WJF0_9RHOO|nr:transglutaminase-like cysteine peptidase [Rhodocyclus gracilis]NJA88729.1 hypothetical protein [Rhodocyclus gracilis]
MSPRRACVVIALGLIAHTHTATAYLDQPSPGLLRYAATRFGPPAPPRILHWQHERAPSDIGSLGQLAAINAKANAIPPVSDLEHWQQAEYWATPLEFVASNGGDCEDYAIAKYFALRDAGVPSERLRMTYVRALNGSRIENHMVLAYYATPGGEPLILDNLNPRVLPVSERPDLIPVFSFNDDDVRRDGVPMVRRWKDLRQRMQSEGEL